MTYFDGSGASGSDDFFRRCDEERAQAEIARLRRENAALTAALIAALDATMWKPILSAPKDGTAVLLCWAVDADGKTIDWTMDTTTAGVYVQVASWSETDLSWWVYCDMVSDPPLFFDPTHWMPLPAPPTHE